MSKKTKTQQKPAKLMQITENIVSSPIPFCELIQKKKTYNNLWDWKTLKDVTF